MDGSIILAAVSAAVAILTLSRLMHGDSRNSGAEIASIGTKLDFVANDLKDIKAEQRNNRNEIKELRDLARHAATRADAAHERLDRAGIDIKEDA